MTRKNGKQILHYAVFGVLALVSLMIFHIWYKYHFFIQEQNCVFIFSRQSVAEYFGQNAWLVRLTGDFLTQFFYYLYAGPAITSAIILAVAVECHRCLKKIIGDTASFAATVMAEVFLFFVVFNNGFKIDFLLTVIVGALAADIYSSIFKKRRCWTAVAVIAILYYLAGFAQIVFAGFCALMMLREKRLADLLIVSAVALVIPIFGHRFFQTTYARNLVYPGFCTPALPDSHAELSYAIATEYYFRHFDKVEQLALRQDTMTAQSGIYYNMVQAQRGLLPDKILEQKVPELGTLVHIDQNSPTEAVCLMNDFYFLIGDMAMAERAAIMASVFSPDNRNVKMLKRLCEINLVTGDTAVALKYVRILEKTLLYKDWAQKHNPYLLDADVAKEIAEKRKFLNRSKNIRLNDDCREILIELLESNPDNIIALDYLLCTDLILGQRQTFKADYYKYCVQKGRQRLNNLYIEALSK